MTKVAGVQRNAYIALALLESVVDIEANERSEPEGRGAGPCAVRVRSRHRSEISKAKALAPRVSKQVI